MSVSFKKALDAISETEEIKWLPFKEPFKCPNCGAENPNMDWCADAYYGTYNIEEFKNLTLDSLVNCKKCDRDIKLKFKLIAFAGEKEVTS